MAREENEFQKLLSEAPMAPSADTVTVVGALSRTADPARFVLTLPGGQSETFDVAAVKSAKKVAGAVGQSLVEVELDAKRIPGKASEIINKNPFYDQVGGQTIWYWDNTGAAADAPYTGIRDIHHTLPQFETAGTGVVDVVHTGALEAVGPNQSFGPMPFAAAMPHQADPATMAALAYSANAFSGTRTYLNWNVWTGDHHTILKAMADPQSI